MDHKKIIEYLLLACVTSSAAMLVANISKMNDTLVIMTSSIQELNSRMEDTGGRISRNHEILKDHESRLRQIERTRFNGRDRIK